jgi:hypothetical protein
VAKQTVSDEWVFRGAHNKYEEAPAVYDYAAALPHVNKIIEIAGETETFLE